MIRTVLKAGKQMRELKDQNKELQKEVDKCKQEKIVDKSTITCLSEENAQISLEKQKAYDQNVKLSGQHFGEVFGNQYDFFYIAFLYWTFCRVKELRDQIAIKDLKISSNEKKYYFHWFSGGNVIFFKSLYTKFPSKKDHVSIFPAKKFLK